MKSVYSAVRTGSLNKAVCASSLRVKFLEKRIKCHSTAVPPKPLLAEEQFRHSDLQTNTFSYPMLALHSNWNSNSSSILPILYHIVTRVDEELDSTAHPSQ